MSDPLCNNVILGGEHCSGPSLSMLKIKMVRNSMVYSNSEILKEL